MLCATGVSKMLPALYISASADVHASNPWMYDMMRSTNNRVSNDDLQKKLEELQKQFETATENQDARNGTRYHTLAQLLKELQEQQNKVQDNIEELQKQFDTETAAQDDANAAEERETAARAAVERLVELLEEMEEVEKEAGKPESSSSDAQAANDEKGTEFKTVHDRITKQKSKFITDLIDEN